MDTRQQCYPRITLRSAHFSTSRAPDVPDARSSTHLPRKRTIMPPTSVGRGIIKMMAGDCLSVCRVSRLGRTPQQEGLEAQNRQNGSTSHRQLVNLFTRQKVKCQGHQAD